MILNDEEKEGCKREYTSCPNFLKEIMFDFGAVDLRFSENKFTWSNKRWDGNCIK